MKLISFFVFWVFSLTPVAALEVQKVSDNVYALVGELAQRSPQNLGNNATFGVVVTDEGVVLIDAGGSYQGAAAIDAILKSITDQPVRYVINTGGQDHRWIGNSYWQDQGAEVIASSAAVADHKDRASQQMSGLNFLIGDALEGTQPAFADITFDESYQFELGHTEFQLHFRGQAHTPGDSFVWLPGSKTMFAGDIVYIDRLLGIGPQSHSAEWITAFEAMAAFEIEDLIPGHGPATDMLTATAQTYDYLTNLRTQMGNYMDSGGGIIGSVNVDQSGFAYLRQFDQLAKRNAQQVYSEMEFE